MDILEFDPNMLLLAKVYGVAILCFGIVFISTVRYVYRRHKTQQISFNTEVSLVKLNVMLLRVVLVWLMVLQYPLLTHALEYPDKTSSFESIVRPVGGFVVLAFGFVVNGHPMFRWIFGLSMLYLVVFDTASEVILNNDVACLERGQACSGRVTSIDAAKFYIWRDLLAIGAELWCLLQVAYLSIAIGVFSSRYSSRLLATSVPRRNIREILRQHHHHV